MEETGFTKNSDNILFFFSWDNWIFKPFIALGFQLPFDLVGKMKTY